MLPRNKSGVVGLIDYNGQLITSDNVRFSLMTGNAYRCGYRFASVAAGAQAKILFDPSLNGTITGSVYKLKGFLVTSLKSVSMQFYEGAAPSSNGTEVTVYNFNRNSECDPSLNPYAKVYHTPTVAADASGNKYAPDQYVFATSSTIGTLTVTSPGDITDEFSMFCDPTKKYLWVFTNLGDNVTDIAFTLRIIKESNYTEGGR